jgi:hypothetical protein
MLCSNSGQRQLFDNLFQQFIAGDQDGSFRLCLSLLESGFLIFYG